MPEPIHVLVRAARRAVEIQAGREPAAYIAGAPTVLRGAATHTGAYLLQALEEQGWTLAPKLDLDRVADLEDQLRDERDTSTAEIARLRGLLHDVAGSATSFDDERVGYLEVQIDRATWQEIQALEGGETHGED